MLPPVALKGQTTFAKIGPRLCSAQVDICLIEQVLSISDRRRMKIVRDAKDHSLLGPWCQAGLHDLVIPSAAFEKVVERQKSNLIDGGTEVFSDRADFDFRQIGRGFRSMLAVEH